MIICKAIMAEVKEWVIKSLQDAENMTSFYLAVLQGGEESTDILYSHKVWKQKRQLNIEYTYIEKNAICQKIFQIYFLKNAVLALL